MLVSAGALGNSACNVANSVCHNIAPSCALAGAFSGFISTNGQHDMQIAFADPNASYLESIFGVLQSWWNVQWSHSVNDA